MADESSKIPEKTVEQIFDERYPLDKWEDSNYSILDKFSMRGRKGFVTGAAGGLGRNAAAALAQAGADVALVDLPSQEDKLTELAKDMSEEFGPNFITLTDEDGNDIELEYVDALEDNGQTYMAFFPTVDDETDEAAAEDFGLVILKSVTENGEELLTTLDSDEELQRVYDLFMEQLMDEDDENS